MSLLKIANKIEKKLNKVGQEMVNIPIDLATAKARMEQIDANGGFKMKPSGAALNLVTKLYNKQPIMEQDVQSGLADALNYGKENTEIGFEPNDLEHIHQLLNVQVPTTASRVHSNLIKAANKILINKLSKKINKIAQEIGFPTPAQVQDAVMKGTSALFFNNGGGGFDKITAKVMPLSDGSEAYYVYMTLHNHDKAMSQFGEDLNDQVLATLQKTWPTIPFNTIYTH